MEESSDGCDLMTKATASAVKYQWNTSATLAMATKVYLEKKGVAFDEKNTFQTIKHGETLCIQMEEWIPSGRKSATVSQDTETEQDNDPKHTSKSTAYQVLEHH